MTRRREPFEQVLARLDNEITATARNQRVPGLTVSEVRTEMIECLWRAQRTYRSIMPLTLEQYWWAIWLNRRINLTQFYFAQKRDGSREALVEGLTWLRDEGEDETFHPIVTIEDFLFPACPSSDPLARQVWELLARGFRRQDVLDVLEISKSVYYSIIEGWRLPTIKENLT